MRTVLPKESFSEATEKASRQTGWCLPLALATKLVRFAGCIPCSSTRIVGTRNSNAIKWRRITYGLGEALDSIISASDTNKRKIHWEQCLQPSLIQAKAKAGGQQSRYLGACGRCLSIYYFADSF